MIEEFEVIEKKTERFGILYKCKFKLQANDSIYYSEYAVGNVAGGNEFRLNIFLYYYNDPDYRTKAIIFSRGQYEEIKRIILSQKEIRLRHLVSLFIIK